ncbi:MAG: NlpC/P60 family protein [Boseongicola sp. SB0677_bin_26]|nr:NlpC/P60 family protein [Boseongicola sp. SB0665_bin_10]MYG27474.1 NlpC/P60 family protein [Boseongicola sp. SB0677_bin_26]
MSDRRFLAANGRVAKSDLKGIVDADRFTDGQAFSLAETAWLRDSPGGRAVRQLIFGDRFVELEREGSWSFGQSSKDGYVGHVESACLGEACRPTHRVAVRSTFARERANARALPVQDLHLNSGVRVKERTGAWCRVASRDRMHVPAAHLAELDSGDGDVAGWARVMLGTPYVWAGNSGFGIDCSGLVQAAFHAAGLECPPDSDLQEAMPGDRLSKSDTPNAGDLVFWKGHVAIAGGEGTLIHANAHHMAVVEEPAEIAVARIAATDTGPVTSRLRPTRTARQWLRPRWRQAIPRRE